MYLPLTLLISLQFSLPIWASVSLVPPSTFPTVSATSSSASTSTSRASATSVTVSGSRSSSLSASTTSSADFPSLSGFSTCLTNCLAVAIARVNCTSVVDVNCFCVAPTFPDELTACVENDGCGSDLHTAENLAQQFCNIASASPSLSFQSIPTSSPTNSSLSSAPSTASSSASSTSPSSTPTSSSGPRTVHQGTFFVLVLGILLSTVW